MGLPRAVYPLDGEAGRRINTTQPLNLAVQFLTRILVVWAPRTGHWQYLAPKMNFLKIKSWEANPNNYLLHIAHHL